jgi:site-specific recombinase XerD
MPTVKLNAKLIKRAKCASGDRAFFWDTTLPGFGLQVTAAGTRSYVLQYRADGLSRRMKLEAGTLAEARRQAKAALGDVAKGLDPLADRRKQRDARADTLRSIVEGEYLTNAEIKKLRSFEEKRATFRRYIFPALGPRPIAEIRRREIVRLLERLKEKHGPASANASYKTLRRLFAWYAARDDDFRSPIVAGTFAVTTGPGARSLVDDEIRLLWKVSAEGRNAYDHFLRFTLLTATRLREAANMPRAELSPDGREWTIPAARYKGEDGKSAHPHLIPLSRLAREALASVPVLKTGGVDSKYVFTTDGRVPISAFSNFKYAIDKRLFAALAAEGDATRDRIIADLDRRYPGLGYQPFGKGWSPHSLRKSARTLLSRIGVDKATAERCLGHVDGGIVGTYDHHRYKNEKAIAFEALAGEIERVVGGGGANVIPLLGRGAH